MPGQGLPAELIYREYRVVAEIGALPPGALYTSDDALMVGVVMWMSAHMTGIRDLPGMRTGLEKQVVQPGSPD